MAQWLKRVLKRKPTTAEDLRALNRADEREITKLRRIIIEAVSIYIYTHIRA